MFKPDPPGSLVARIKQIHKKCSMNKTRHPKLKLFTVLAELIVDGLLLICLIADRFQLRYKLEIFYTMLELLFATENQTRRICRVTPSHRPGNQGEFCTVSLVKWRLNILLLVSSPSWWG